MEQLISSSEGNKHYKNREYPAKHFPAKEDPQKIVNLYGKAIDDLEIILFQKKNLVPTFQNVTPEEKELILQTKVKAAYIILAINKELALMQLEIMDALEKTELNKRLREIKEQILKSKDKKIDPIKSLAIEDIKFLHQVFNKRFEANLKEINEAGAKVFAS